MVLIAHNTPVDKILEGIQGWDYLDLENPKTEEARQQMATDARQIDKIIHQVFAQTDNGKFLLKWLVQRTIMKPIYNKGDPDQWTYIREGQNNLVRQLLTAIERMEVNP